MMEKHQESTKAAFNTHQVAHLKHIYNPPTQRRSVVHPNQQAALKHIVPGTAASETALGECLSAWGNFWIDATNA